MYAQVEKPKENKSRAIANSVTQEKSRKYLGFGIVDNRTEAVAENNSKILWDNGMVQLAKNKGAKKALAKQKQKEQKARDAIKALNPESDKYVELYNKMSNEHMEGKDTQIGHSGGGKELLAANKKRKREEKEQLQEELENKQYYDITNHNISGKNKDGTYYRNNPNNVEFTVVGGMYKPSTNHGGPSADHIANPNLRVKPAFTEYRDTIFEALASVNKSESRFDSVVGKGMNVRFTINGILWEAHRLQSRQIYPTK